MGSDSREEREPFWPTWRCPVFNPAPGLLTENNNEVSASYSHISNHLTEITPLPTGLGE